MKTSKPPLIALINLWNRNNVRGPNDGKLLRAIIRTRMQPDNVAVTFTVAIALEDFKKWTGWAVVHGKRYFPTPRHRWLACYRKARASGNIGGF